MSNPLAVASVTAVLLDVLRAGLSQIDLAPIGTYRVSASPPDRVLDGDDEPNRLNLFLYQVTPNQGWRNADLPSHDARGVRRANPALALDLHYLLTAYGAEDLSAEMLLGCAMEQLFEYRVLNRNDIRRVLSGAAAARPGQVAADAQGRLAADLADQIEQIKLTPVYPSTDELSKLWTALQSGYRTSVAYQASVVLIRPVRPQAAPLPVLTRGEADTGPVANADLTPRTPVLTSVSVNGAAGRAVQLGDTLRVEGFGLANAQRALLRHVGAGSAVSTAVTIQDGAVTIDLPGQVSPTDLRAGIYALSLRCVAPARTIVVNGVEIDTPERVVTSNEVAVTIAPRITTALPLDVARAANGSVTIRLAVTPRVHPGQRASVLLGGDEAPAVPVTADGDVIEAVINNAPVGAATLRVRVDGADSLLVADPTATPPRFDPTQIARVT